MLIALIPAHNEQDCIANAIAGLQGQTVKPDAIMVVADNCTDDTMKVSFSHSVNVVATRDNTDKKAGALNQVLSTILPLMRDDDHILVTDADSVLDHTFVQTALETLKDPIYGGVGGTFRGDPGGGFVGHLQRNEYTRYARDVRRLKGRCLVITGTAAVFPVHVLRQISQARISGQLPEGNGLGGIYDTSVLTEDNELSFAIMHLGYKIIAPNDCTLTTEVMPNWGDLWKQRTRWKRGAVENCIQYGFTRITARYWGRQIFSVLGLLVTALYLISTILFAVAGTMTIQPIWLCVTAVFVIERVVTVRDSGLKQMLLSATMYELILDFFLQAAHAKAYIDTLFKRKKVW